MRKIWNCSNVQTLFYHWRSVLCCCFFLLLSLNNSVLYNGAELKKGWKVYCMDPTEQLKEYGSKDCVSVRRVKLPLKTLCTLVPNCSCDLISPSDTMFPGLNTETWHSFGWFPSIIYLLAVNELKPRITCSTMSLHFCIHSKHCHGDMIWQSKMPFTLQKNTNNLYLICFGYKCGKHGCRPHQAE